jgi:hypothetical protein
VNERVDLPLTHAFASFLSLRDCIQAKFLLLDSFGTLAVSKPELERSMAVYLALKHMAHNRLAST